MSAVGNFLKNTTTRRGVAAIVCFVIIWHIGAMFDDWTGVDILGIGLVPPPSDVFAAFLGVIPKVGYWMSWVSSFSRVLTGFLVAIYLLQSNACRSYKIEDRSVRLLLVVHAL